MSVRGFYAALDIALLECNGREAGVRCFANPDAHTHADRNRSASVNLDSGVWCCHGCGAGGGPYDAALVLGMAPREAMVLLKRHGLVSDDDDRRASASKPRLAVTEAQVERYRDALIADEAALERLRELRGWTVPALERFDVGLDGGRVTFPLRDSEGALVGLARYAPDPKRRNGVKLIAAPGSRRELFPAPEAVQGSPLFIGEGEGTALSCLSVDLSAVGIGGVQGWRSEWAGRFTRREVVVCMDCDDKGREAAERVAYDLAGRAASVRVLDLDTGRSDGYDVADFLRDAQTDAERDQARELLLRAADAAPRFVLPETDAREQDAPDLAHEQDITLADILSRELPHEEWIVPDVIAPATIGFLHGLPETFKTFLALHLALGVAAATSDAEVPLVFGRLPVKLGGPIGYAWQDDSEVEEMRRVQAVAQAVSADRNLPAYFLLNRGLRIDRPEDVERLRRWVEHRGLVLMVLDSLKDFTSVGSTKDDSWVLPTLNSLKMICDTTGVCILIVHHDHLPHADTKGRAAGQTMHGSVFLEAGARTGLHCQRPDPVKPEVKITRWGNSGKPWGPNLMRFDEDTCELELVDVSHNEPKVAPVKYRQALEETGGGMFVDELAAKLGVTTNTAKRNAENAGAEIVQRKRGRVKPNYAQLPGAQDELTT